MTEEPQAPTGWRYQLGFWMFTIPFAMVIGAPIVVPFVVSSATEAAATIGAIIIAAEVIWFASIPLLGVSGFKSLKSKAFGKLALPEGPISPERTKLGARLFSFGFLLQQIVLFYLLVGTLATAEEDLSKGLLGLTLVQEAAIIATAILISAVSFVASLYLMGMPFIRRLRDLFSGAETS